MFVREFVLISVFLTSLAHAAAPDSDAESVMKGDDAAAVGE